MRDRIWFGLVDAKFRTQYLAECARRAAFWGSVFSIALALAFAPPIAAWAIWHEFPWAWAGVAMVAQTMHVVRPQLPLLKNEAAYGRMSVDFGKLFLKYERLWYRLEDDRIDLAACEARWSELRQEEEDIPQRQGIIVPYHKKTEAKARERALVELGPFLSPSQEGVDDGRES
ncbi:MAG: hypothetical protein ACYS9X_16835 [Planctomycetota bacterium]|jgi:hypothetical protein